MGATREQAGPRGHELAFSTLKEATPHDIDRVMRSWGAKDLRTSMKINDKVINYFVEAAFWRHMTDQNP